MKALDDVVAERDRQRHAEGWTEAHDDAYSDGELSRAAASYCLPDSHVPAHFWPWAAEWWKPTTPRRNLVKAAALIIAEIDRIDRAESRKEAM